MLWEADANQQSYFWSSEASPGCQAPWQLARSSVTDLIPHLDGTGLPPDRPRPALLPNCWLERLPLNNRHWQQPTASSTSSHSCQRYVPEWHTSPRAQWHWSGHRHLGGPAKGKLSWRFVSLGFRYPYRVCNHFHKWLGHCQPSQAGRAPKNVPMAHCQRAYGNMIMS